MSQWRIGKGNEGDPSLLAWWVSFFWGGFLTVENAGPVSRWRDCYD